MKTMFEYFVKELDIPNEITHYEVRLGKEKGEYTMLDPAGKFDPKKINSVMAFVNKWVHEGKGEIWVVKITEKITFHNRGHI
jgi:hypothetical protein